jgi:hypothetical protein
LVAKHFASLRNGDTQLQTNNNNPLVFKFGFELSFFKVTKKSSIKVGRLISTIIIIIIIIIIIHFCYKVIKRFHHTKSLG